MRFIFLVATFVALPAQAAETFTEEDFYWDDNTRPYKEIIIAGVNKVHRENSRCKEIDPGSAYISGSKGTPENPVFFVTCGSSRVFNVFFSKSDVEQDKRMVEAKHIDRTKAAQLCEQYAKQAASHPSTVDFSHFMDISFYETPNGRTRVTSTFTAKNSFGAELEHQISCLVDSSGLIDASVTQVQ